MISEQQTESMRMLRLCLSLLTMAMILAIQSSRSQADDPPFNPVGVWRSYHKDGTSFEVRIFADGRATSTADGGQQGTWRWEGKAVRIVFTDGWDDVLEAGEGGQMLKKSWGPKADRSQPSKNVSQIELLPREPEGH